MESVLNKTRELASHVQQIDDNEGRQELQLILKQLEAAVAKCSNTPDSSSKQASVPSTSQDFKPEEEGAVEDEDTTLIQSRKRKTRKPKKRLLQAPMIIPEFEPERTDNPENDESLNITSHSTQDFDTNTDLVDQTSYDCNDDDQSEEWKVASDEEVTMGEEEVEEEAEEGIEDDCDGPSRSKGGSSVIYGDTCKLCEVIEQERKETEDASYQVVVDIKDEPSPLKVYDLVSNLSDHIYAVHAQTDESTKAKRPHIQCPFCPKRYFIHSTAKSCYNYTIFHLYRKHGKQALPRNFLIYHCEQCPFETLRRRDVKRHNLVMHSNITAKDRGEPCPECGKYVLKSSMLLHLASTHGVQNVPAQVKARTELRECDICNRKFKGAAGLERHKKCVHSKIKEQLCHLCSQAFFAKRELELHMFSTHKINISKSKVLRCEVEGCNYETLARRHLFVHSAVHKTTKDFICDFCGKCFKNQPAIRQHIRIMHTTDKEYKCPKCFFKSHAKQYVTRHMVIHSDTKNHKCQYEGCSYETHFIENLNKHKKKHLKEVK